MSKTICRPLIPRMDYDKIKHHQQICDKYFLLQFIHHCPQQTLSTLDYFQGATPLQPSTNRVSARRLLMHFWVPLAQYHGSKTLLVIVILTSFLASFFFAIYIYVCMYVYIYIYTCMYVCVYIYVCMCIYIYVYMYIYIHTFYTIYTHRCWFLI